MEKNSLQRPLVHTAGLLITTLAVKSYLWWSVRWSGNRLNYTKQSADKFTKQGEQDWGGRYIDVDHSLLSMHAVLWWWWNNSLGSRCSNRNPRRTSNTQKESGILPATLERSSLGTKRRVRSLGWDTGWFLACVKGQEAGSQRSMKCVWWK